MEHTTKETSGLPENAYRELKEGEEYTPIVKANEQMKEVTPYSVIMGIIMAIIFSGATAFIGLKTGNVFEAAIPIALIAVGISLIPKLKISILENVIIQSIGAASGSVVAGAIFTLPALFILQAKYPEITIDFMKIFMASLLGGILGIVFLIFFRRYFVSEMHGKFPFPEGTATTEILVSGSKGGDQAKILGISMALGAAYDFFILSCNLWKETFTSKVIPGGIALYEKAKVLFAINTTASILGMGYIIGFKYAAIICAGSFLAWFVFVPLLGAYVPSMAVLPAEIIFKEHVRLIGIGGIACAGVIGIIKSSGIIIQAFTLGFKEMFASKKDEIAEKPRTDRDLKMGVVFGIIIATTILIFIFFNQSVLKDIFAANPVGAPNLLKISIVALIVVLVISFLFTSVAARAIATVGTNPVSGMTLMTLILSSLILVQVGLKGTAGMTAALLIGGVVCTALSMSGAFITDLKIGYWIGSTPKSQQTFKFLGVLVSSFAVAGVIILLNNTYGFVPKHAGVEPLVAPQANAMAAVIETFMSSSQVPWVLYIVGIVMALILEFIGVPALAFMLGVFIPLEYNLPVLAGGILATFVEKSHKNPEIAAKRKEKGTMIASGLIAGGAIIGVMGAILKNYKINLDLGIGNTALGEWLSIIIYIGLAAFVYFLATRDGNTPAVLTATPSGDGNNDNKEHETDSQTKE